MTRSASSRLAVTLLALLTAGPAVADTRCLPREDAAYFSARYQWYVSTYGENGVFNPERRLALLHDAYAELLSARSARGTRDPLAPIEPGAFRFLGPTNGAGRMTTVEPHPTDPNVVYVGAAGGGCWKSTDGGVSWRCLTDGLADLSVGAVALAPSDPRLVYLGTGEGGYAIDFIPGIGILRSTDGGESWILPDSVVASMVYRLSVDPRNAQNVLAFTNAGVLRSLDGGRTYSLTSDPGWGDATDVARDPGSPDVLHATFWLRGSAEQGRYARSTDNGVTWVERSTGLAATRGRMSVAASGDGRSVYLLASGISPDYTQVGVYRSSDRGDTWTRGIGASPNILTGQGWYNNTVAVDPDNPQRIYLGGGAGGGTGHYRSEDGGLNVAVVGRADEVHVDVHHLVARKYGSSTVVWTANDGGIWKSTDGGARWIDANAGLATRQYYSVAVDWNRPERMIAGSQDNGTDLRPGDSTEFTHVLGGDGFEGAVDPDSPGVYFGSSQFATISRSRSSAATGTFNLLYSPLRADPTRPFLSWITLDPNDPRTVYTGTHRVWRSEDGGDTWVPLNDTGWTSGTRSAGLAVAKGRQERLLAAQDTRLFVSNDRGASWTLLGTANGLPSTLRVRNVEIDPTNPDVFYVALSSSSAARVYRSSNAGLSWSRADQGLPDFGVETVRVDPGDAQTLYAGTLVGLYRSRNAGVTWERFGDGLPAAAIHEVRVAPDGSRVVVATHGRGIWGAEALRSNRPPTAVITAQPSSPRIQPGASVTFSGIGSDPEGGAVTLRWSFGDGMTATGDGDRTVTYRTPGRYTVSLSAEDAAGGRGAAFTELEVVAPNDACADAQSVALANGLTTVTRTGTGTATTAGDPALSCADVTYSVWYALTAPADGTLEIDSLGSSSDTVLALYGGTCGAPGAALACNDDADDLPGVVSQLPARNVTKGTTYRLLAASFADDNYGPLDSFRVRTTFRASASGAETPGTTAILPVVLDAYGRNDARFLSELYALNRGTAPLTLALSYGGPLLPGGDGTSSIVLAPGEQLRAPDALQELRRQGISVPKATPSASQVGSLTALVTEGDPSSLVLASRTFSPNPNAAVGGSFGLFATGTPFSSAADGEAVYVYGLRQTERDRANLALVHVRSPRPGTSEAPISLSVEVFGASGGVAGSPIAVELAAGEWKQINEVLSAAGLAPGDANGGYVRVRRTAGTGRFVAYGVVNDQRTADGSWVPMARSGELKASGEILVPIVLEAGGVGGSFFTSELVLASRSSRAGTANLRYVAAPVFGAAGSGTVSVPLPAGGQKVIPDFIQFLRQQGLGIPSGSAQGGALFVTFSGLDAGDDVYAGVRTSTPNRDAAQGGTFGVFSPGVPPGGLSTGSVTVPGLRQDVDVRSNLALVNAGGSPITLDVQLKQLVAGLLSTSTVSRTLDAGEWYQLSGVLDRPGLVGNEAWAHVTRVEGSSPFYVYGVLNDARTSDGSVIAPAF